jgi:2-keto-3-deoxy-L-rhamnonate aldolase RhmA
MENARYFRERIDAGEALIGPSISLADPIVTEIVLPFADFLWIDAVDTIVKKARDRKRYLGVGIGTDVEVARQWIDRGVQWIQLGVDFMYLREHWRSLSTAARGSS